MEQSLSHLQWTVAGYHPFIPIQGKSMETLIPHTSLTGDLPATVPGGVHRDLYDNGLLPYPYDNQNSLACEWVEHRWWVYRVNIPLPEARYERLSLVFLGVDYEALFYLDTCLAAQHRGMYTPVTLDLTAYQGNPSVALEVIFKGIPQEMGQVGDTALTSTQKSRFNYKWDFSTRLVNMGIWQDVLLRGINGYEIQQLYLRPTLEGNTGIIGVEMALAAAQGYSCFEDALVTVDVLDGDQWVAGGAFSPNSLGRVNARLTVDAPKLWWPNGHGPANLYTLHIRVQRAGQVVAERQCKTGIRSLAYAKNQGAPADALPYTFVVNGKKIYIKGVNMTPLDHVYGAVTHAHYRQIILTIRHMHVNMIRIWGGGLIEKEWFYQLCDEHGILVWQEFIQSSSGIGNAPAKDPAFLHLLADNAKAALYEKRNHVSLAVWSGGNELMKAENTPVDYGDPNIALLKDLVAWIDPDRLFLPASASGPREFIDLKQKGVSHDVHGSWQYGGNPGHYDFYNQSDSLFHSEFGADGLSAMKSLLKCIDPKHLTPKRMNDDPMWVFHGQWWGTYNRDMDIFGRLPDMNTFVRCSQWIQAEALRYALEANLRRKFNNAGSIIWQVNEPWPNISCTNLVDYFGEAKMAYYWARKAYAPRHASLRYDKLDYTPGERACLPLYINNCPSEPFRGRVEVTVRALSGEVLVQHNLQGQVEGNACTRVGEVAFTVTQAFGPLFVVSLGLMAQDDGLLDSNTYYFATQAQHPYAPALALTRAQLRWTLVEKRGGQYTYHLENVGQVIALHLYAQEETDHYTLLGDGLYESLFPGESMTVTLALSPRVASGFLPKLPGEGPREPLIVFTCMNDAATGSPAPACADDQPS